MVQRLSSAVPQGLPAPFQKQGSDVAGSVVVVVALVKHVDVKFKTWTSARLHIAECETLFVTQLCQICTENPDIVLLKVDFDENRDTVKPLGIKVGLLCAFTLGCTSCLPVAEGAQYLCRSCPRCSQVSGFFYQFLIIAPFLYAGAALLPLL